MSEQKLDGELLPGGDPSRPLSECERAWMIAEVPDDITLRIALRRYEATVSSLESQVVALKEELERARSMVIQWEEWHMQGKSRERALVEALREIVKEADRTGIYDPLIRGIRRIAAEAIPSQPHTVPTPSETA